jgi:hypothetical protein
MNQPLYRSGAPALCQSDELLPTHTRCVVFHISKISMNPGCAEKHLQELIADRLERPFKYLWAPLARLRIESCSEMG